MSPDSRRKASCFLLDTLETRTHVHPCPLPAKLLTRPCFDTVVWFMLPMKNKETFISWNLSLELVGNENFGIVSVTGFHLFREIHFLFLVWLHQHECDSFTCIVDGPIYPFFYMNWASKEAPYCPAELGQCLLEICCIDCLNWAKYSCQTYLGYNIVSDSWRFFHY